MRSSEAERPILVAGMPRSGTTWVARAIARGAKLRYVHEPDNEKLDPFALWGKYEISRFPWLQPERDCERYRCLWDRAFSGIESTSRRARWSRSFFDRASRDDLERAVAARRLSLCLRASVLLQPTPFDRRSAARPRVVKSVHSAFALAWLAARFPFRAIVVSRHPLNVIASWRRLELPDASRPLEDDPDIQRFSRTCDIPLPSRDAAPGIRQAWRFGIIALALEQAGSGGGDWLTVRHEHLCTQPEKGFARLARNAGVAWTREGTEFLRQSDRPGKGFETRRRTADVPDRWRHALTDDEVRDILDTVRQFPVDPWNHDPPT